VFEAPPDNATANFEKGLFNTTVYDRSSIIVDKLSVIFLFPSIIEKSGFFYLFRYIKLLIAPYLEFSTSLAKSTDSSIGLFTRGWKNNIFDDGIS